MRVLVTGGAGYVGSQIAWTLHDHGHKPVILDNLSTGHAKLVSGFPFYQADISDHACLEAIFRDFAEISTVIHCAASPTASGFARLSLDCYRNNVGGAIEMLRCLQTYRIRSIIFSSSASVYCDAPSAVVDEDSPVSPTNPYAWSKLFLERILYDYSKTAGINALALRCFEPVGADIEGRCGNLHAKPSHLLESLLSATGQRAPFRLYGTQWNSRDGTAIRDCVDVVDLARAHVAAIDALATRRQESFVNSYGLPVVNIGSGTGMTVQEFVDVYRRLIDQQLRVEYVEARPRDIRGNVAKITKAHELLNWTPVENIEDAVRRATRWARRGGRTHTEVRSRRRLHS